MSEDAGLAGLSALVAVTKGIYSFEGKKVLVLGSTGHAGVICSPWVGPDLPNIVDFDICVVNISSLTNDILAATKHEHFETIGRQLVRLLMSNGTLIVLVEKMRAVKTPKQYPERTHNYRNWFPLNLRMWEESGKTIELLQENVFPKYLSKLNHWTFYHLCDGLGEKMQAYISEDGKYHLSTDVIARNREGRELASSYQVQFFEKKKTGLALQKTSGPIVLLPALPEVDDRDAVALVLQDMGIVQQATMPTWATAVDIPGASKLQEEIMALGLSLGEIKNKISQREAEHAKLRRYTELLYATGPQLEEIFRETLILLGANVTEAKYAKEEYILNWKKQECLVEVKGNTKSVSLDNLRQVLDYTLHYQKDTGKEGKGILFGNAWRLLPLNERDTPATPIFPDDVKKTAAKHGIALVSSTAFFDALCRYLKGELTGESILDRMANTDGLVTF